MPARPAISAPAAPPYLVQSADHALMLLRAVTERRALRVGEAAQLLGVAPSTAHRLLGTLCHQGFVVQERRGGAYVPGPTLTELALISVGTTDIRGAVRPILERLRAETQETVSLLMLEQNRVRFVDSLESPRAVRVTSRLGVVLPAHCTSGGKAMLAALAPDELARRYPGRLEVRSPRSISDLEHLERALDEVRRRGYATNFDEGDAGIGGVGCCIHDAAGGPLAAIAIAAPLGRLGNRKAAAPLAEQLVAAVHGFERTLFANSAAEH